MENGKSEMENGTVFRQGALLTAEERAPKPAGASKCAAGTGVIERVPIGYCERSSQRENLYRGCTLVYAARSSLILYDPARSAVAL